jgi:DHA1 family multidrug resistance protein-like MFS transporter
MERWKKNLIILCIGQFLFMASMSQIIPFLPLYLQELGITDPKEVSKWAGIIFGIQFLTAFIVSPIWGKLADRHGRKIMLIRSGIGMAIVITLMGFATNHIHLLILRLINGLISGFIPAAIALTATNTPKERVGYALGVLQSGAVAGTICGPLIGGIMADIVGFRAIFSYTGISVFLATIIVILFVHETFEKKENEAKTGFIDDFKVIVSKKPILSLFGVTTLIQLAMLGTLPLIPLYVQELAPSTNYLAFLAGLTGAVMGFANMVASPQLGKLGDKHGSHYILVFSILGAAIFTLPQAFVQELWQLITLRFFVGLCLGGMLPSIHSLIRHYAPEGMESRTYSYSNSAIFLGNLVGPIVGGLLASELGLRSIFIWASVLLFITVIWVKWLLLSTIQGNIKRKQTT